MSIRTVRLGLLGALLGGVAAGIAVFRTSIVAAALPAAAHGREVAGGDPLPAATLDSLVAAAIAHPPFRAGRRPPEVRYDPSSEGQAPLPIPPAAPKPALMLSGLVWGPEPTAIIEGLPGLEGPRVVRRLDRVGELSVRKIERDRVIISGLDTTWTLRVREPWR
jgi:hypothetical protein